MGKHNKHHKHAHVAPADETPAGEVAATEVPEAPATPEPAAAPVNNVTGSPITKAVEALASTAFEKASPFISPVVARAKSSLPSEVVEKFETVAASASTYSHELLQTADDALISLRKTPDVVRTKVAEGNQIVNDKVQEGSDFVRSRFPQLPTSLAGLKEASTEQVANLMAAISKLRASLPASISDIKLPEERVEQVRGAIGKVLEALPKLPAFELPKVDLAQFSPQELVKLGHKLVDQVLPLIAPYQERVNKLLVDYKVTERAADFQQQAVGVYKRYKLEKVVPRFVNSLIVGEPVAAPVVAAQ